MIAPQYPHTPAEQPEVPVYQGGIALRCPQCSHVVYTRFCSFCGNDLAASYAPPGTPVPPPPPAQAGFPSPQPPSPQEWKTPAPPPPGWTPPPQPGWNPPPFPAAQPAPPQEWKTLTPPSQPGFQSPPPQGWKTLVPPPPPGWTSSPQPGFQPPPPQGWKAQPPKPKGYRPPAWMILLSVLLFLAVFTLSFFGFSALYRRNTQTKPESGIEWAPPADKPSANNKNSNPGGVSLEEYSRLKIGMTYAQVSGIIGNDGILVDIGTNLDGDKYYIYGWTGQDNPLAEVYITFVENQVVEITQQNLLDE